MLTRRSLLLGGADVGISGAAGLGVGVQQGVLPGRPWVQERLGLNGEAGVVPDVEPGSIERGSFVSSRRGGVETGWALLRPPGLRDLGVPVVVALHGLGGTHETLISPQLGLDRFLAAHVAPGGRRS